MKRTIPWALTVAVLTMLLAGCSGDEKPAGDEAEDAGQTGRRGHGAGGHVARRVGRKPRAGGHLGAR